MVNQQSETPDRPRRRRWFRLRDWPVRGRLVALIAVPTVVAVAFGVIGVIGAVGSARGDRHAQTLATLGGQLTELVARVQNEQTAAAVYVAGGRTDNGGLRTAYRAVDAATGAPQRTLTSGIDDTYPATTQARARGAAFRIAELRNLRSTVETSKLPANVVIDKYNTVVTELLALDDEIAAETADPDLVASTRALGAVSRVKAEIGTQRSLVAAALTAGRFDLGGVPALSGTVSAQQSAFGQFQVAATGEQSQHYAFVVTGRDVDQTQTILNQVTSSGGAWVTTAPPEAAQTWQNAVTGNLNKVRQVEQDLTGQITDRATTLSDNAIRQAVIAGVIVLALLIIVLVTTGLVARSLVRPLRALRLGALDVADDRLPAVVSRLRTETPDETEVTVEPIAVNSADEIGQVARAFDEVHRVATELAGEQARLRGQVNALFVGLSRRSQSLVERQLEVIDSLEQEEQDASRLRNLFTLDHLATRMRRNGENLLVLGGQEPSRRFTEAMPLFDVLRAAASEVERYERVHIDDDLPDVYVAEAAVTDLVHLVAELLDNATAFSPPEEPVRVRTRQSSNGGVLVEISDAGIGLAEEDRTAANADLADPPVIQPGVSRHMGLFVVARLARRHGIGVQLAAGEPHGLTVHVGLPPEVATRRLAPPVAAHQPAADEQQPPIPGWPGRRFVAAMTASQAGSTSWFGAEPLPTIGGNGSAPARPAGGQEITAAGETTVGLPQRVPGANYVPGSLHGDPKTPAGPTAPPAPAAGQAPLDHGRWEQSPDALRSRFAAYQTGARRGHAAGRHAAPTPDAPPAPEASATTAPHTTAPGSATPDTAASDTLSRNGIAAQPPTAPTAQPPAAEPYSIPTAESHSAPPAEPYNTPTTESYGATTAEPYSTPTAESYSAATEPYSAERESDSAPAAEPYSASVTESLSAPIVGPPTPRWPVEEPTDLPEPLRQTPAAQRDHGAEGGTDFDGGTWPEPASASAVPGAPPEGAQQSDEPQAPAEAQRPTETQSPTGAQNPVSAQNPAAAQSADNAQSPASAQSPGGAQSSAVQGPTSGQIRAAGQTSVGLPLRSPGANYVPGSLRTQQRPPQRRATHPDLSSASAAFPRRQREPEPDPAPATRPDANTGAQTGAQTEAQTEYRQESWEQSPEALRSRFAAFQTGSRRGHEAAAAGTAWTEPGANGTGSDREPTR